MRHDLEDDVYLVKMFAHWSEGSIVVERKRVVLHQ